MESILVIEDDPRIQKTLTRLFASEGYSTRMERDGAAGLSVALAPEASVTAVVLDLMLPGLSGREVCRAIKSAAPAIT
jgi:DNA-binding response OmpR family regulator